MRSAEQKTWLENLSETALRSVNNALAKQRRASKGPSVATLIIIDRRLKNIKVDASLKRREHRAAEAHFTLKGKDKAKRQIEFMFNSDDDDFPTEEAACSAAEAACSAAEAMQSSK